MHLIYSFFKQNLIDNEYQQKKHQSLYEIQFVCNLNKTNISIALIISSLLPNLILSNLLRSVK